MNSAATRQKVVAGLRRRHLKERIFRTAGMLATGVGVVFLVVFFASLIGQGASAFGQTFVRLDVNLSAELLAPSGEFDDAEADYDAVVQQSLRDRFPEVSGRNDRRELYQIVSIDAAFQVRDLIANEPSLIGSQQSLWVPAAANIDMLNKGRIDPDSDPSTRKVSDRQIEWVRALQSAGELERRFNFALFTNGDSREPELAGIRGALMGSFYMLTVTLLLAFPIGVAAAVYLEEFAPRNRWSDLIEVNINNLAAVPSIIFGLLGLSVFINWMSLPRSAPPGSPLSTQ